MKTAIKFLSPFQGAHIIPSEKRENCQECRLGLNQMKDGTDKRSVPLQDEDHRGNDPHLVSGFPRLCSGMFPEWLRSVSVSVGSRETCLI